MGEIWHNAIPWLRGDEFDAVMNYPLDSHDTKRLRSDTKNLDQYFAQLAVLFAMPGSPCIYYGTEIAMPGSYDPDCRRCMPWDDIEAGRFKERIEMVSKLI